MFSSANTNDTNLYTVLGIERTASAEQIKTAYKKRALETHPDKNPGGTDELFKQVKNAYATLYDSKTRKEYDNSLNFPPVVEKPEKPEKPRDPTPPKLDNLVELVKNNNLSEIKKIISAYKASLKEAWRWRFDNKDIDCAIREAILLGHFYIVKYFLEEGIDVDHYVYAKGNGGFVLPLVYFAAKTGNLTMVQLLVENGAKIYQDKYDRDSSHDHALKAAVKKGHVDIVEYLLSRGASANGNCGRGMHGTITFLARAAQDGNVQIVKLLLEHGAQIEPAISLAHEKLCKHGYQEYDNYLAREFGERHRENKFHYGIDIISQIHSHLYVDFEWTDTAKKVFKTLNGLFKNVEELKNDSAGKSKIADYLVQLGKQFNCQTIDEKRIYQDIDRSISSLEEFDKKQREVEAKRDEIKNNYQRIVSILMDYAIGVNFAKKSSGFFYGEYGGLLFLKDINIAGINFVGVSVGGKPVTREMLVNAKLQGAEKALVTPQNIMNLSDPSRRELLTNLLSKAIEQNGWLIDSEGTVNLVSLSEAAFNGDVETVKTRLAAGADPNEKTSGYNDKYPLIAATEEGHLDIVKMLTIAHYEHTRYKPKSLFEAAKKIITANANQENKCLYFKNGKVKPILPEFNNASYLPIVIEKDYRRLSFMIKQLDNTVLNKEIPNILNRAKEKDEHVVVTLKRDGRTACLFLSEPINTAENKQSLQELLKNIQYRDYYPIFFTDTSNFQLIEMLIEEQYQTVDKGKKLIVEAVEIARNKKITEIGKTRNEKFADISEYLENLQDVNEQDAEGNTLLHKGVGDLNRVKELLAKGADVNLKNSKRETPLSRAIDYCGWPGHEKPYLETISYLLDNNATVRLSDLKNAIKANCPEAFALLISHVDKKDVIKTKYEDYGRKESHFTEAWYVDLMFDAVEHSKTSELLTLLKDHGADFNTPNEHGETLLNLVVYYFPSFNNLRRSMADMQQTVAGCGERGKSALENSFQSLIKQDQENLNKEIQLLDYLIQNGANPGLKNAKGILPLFTLIKDKDLSYLENNYEQLLEKLLVADMDLNACTNNGDTFLHVAARTGDKRALEFLIKHHVNINIQDAQGCTALHLAARNCSLNITQLLIDAGADASIRDSNGLTAEEQLGNSYVALRNRLMERQREIRNEKQRPSYGFFGENNWDKNYKLIRQIDEELQNLSLRYLQTESVLQEALKKKDQTSDMEVELQASSSRLRM